jgi:NAD(P)-dependent dehydrogenase (short-subunit alcohol dehydrogenase family)
MWRWSIAIAHREPAAGLAHLRRDTASKGGIDALTKVAAVELGAHGIRVNCVAPGAIETERTKAEVTDGGDYASTWAKLTPLGRVGQPEDVAAAVTYLASDASQFITGQTLYTDGGLMMQCPWPYDYEEQ